MKIAPHFCLPDESGIEHCLEDYRGKWILLYFYPKDSTPGCTKEARMLRDAWSEFEKNEVIILGVSGDTLESHKKFKEKYKLPFPLLSDTDRKVINKYGVTKEKSMFGKTFLGIKRESFLINPDGVIKKHYQNVQPADHAQEVLSDLTEIINARD
jgi:peroxiredoxin Q/BCP